jgi:hypothetical protein
MKKLIFLVIAATMILAMPALSGSPQTNTFGVVVTCVNPLLTPVDATVHLGSIVADGTAKPVNASTTFKLSADGAHDWTMEILEWDKTVLIDGKPITLDSYVTTSGDALLSGPTTMPTDAGDQFLINTIGNGCNAEATITLHATSVTADAGMKATALIPFTFMLSVNF